MENQALIPNPTSQQGELKRDKDVRICLGIVFGLLLVAAVFHILKFVGEVTEEEQKRGPEITIPSMDFTVLNMTETRLSVKWDLLIRIPPKLPGFYVCLEGDFKVFIAYKGVTIATSPIQSYTLKPHWSKLLKVSLIASEGDMDGAIMKNIVEDIKARGEVRFGSELLFPDCRFGTTGKMNYACDEATLRFEPGSQRDATLVENHTKCAYQP
ncbi:hypothetical protein N665_0259s0036 [Sinapis alba]|nr:hypothetical protein N665_0259s0036 [Sinapis alba]